MGHNDIRELEPGDEIEITYDSNHGERTITAYVVENFDPYPTIDGEKTRIRAAEPEARRPRFLHFDVDHDSSYPLKLLKSENSKADRGRKLGRVENVEATGAVSKAHVDISRLMEATEGAVVDVGGDERVVVDASHTNVIVEDPDGGNRTRYSAHPDGVFESYNRDDGAVTFDLQFEDTWNTDADMTFAAIESYGHDTGRVATGIAVDGAGYELVYRHDAREDGLRFASPGADKSRRNYDTTLTTDPIGLRLTTGIGYDAETRRVDADDVEIIFEPKE